MSVDTSNVYCHGVLWECHLVPISFDSVLNHPRPSELLRRYSVGYDASPCSLRLSPRSPRRRSLRFLSVTKQGENAVSVRWHGPANEHSEALWILACFGIPDSAVVIKGAESGETFVNFPRDFWDRVGAYIDAVLLSGISRHLVVPPVKSNADSSDDEDCAENADPDKDYLI